MWRHVCRLAARRVKEFSISAAFFPCEKGNFTLWDLISN